MKKRNVSLTLDEDILVQLDRMGVNRSRYINTLLRERLKTSKESSKAPPWANANPSFLEDVAHGRIPMPVEWAEHIAATGKDIK